MAPTKIAALSLSVSDVVDDDDSDDNAIPEEMEVEVEPTRVASRTHGNLHKKKKHALFAQSTCSTILTSLLVFLTFISRW